MFVPILHYMVDFFVFRSYCSKCYHRTCTLDKQVANIYIKVSRKRSRFYFQLEKAVLAKKRV